MAMPNPLELEALRQEVERRRLAVREAAVKENLRALQQYTEEIEHGDDNYE
jgi:hypothetical protein